MNLEPELPEPSRVSGPSSIETSAEHDTAPIFMHDLESMLFGFDARRSLLTKSQRAYAAVRRAIVTHALPSSVPLDEGMLLEHFPYGRTPLREALKRLSYEGLLVWPPHQAPMIRDVGLYEMQHLYKTRRVLEYEVATLAAERAMPEDIDRMNLLRTRLSDASRAGYVYEAVELDFALHSAIARATQNRFLVEANNNLNLQSLRLWFRAQHQLGVSTIDRSHTDLVNAITRHDTETTLKLTIAHIDSSLQLQQTLLGADTTTVSP